jgi:hypothetical protein
VLGGRRPRFARMPFVRSRVDAREATPGRGVENSEALHRPFGGRLGGHQEGGISIRVVPLGYGTATIIREKPCGIERRRLGTRDGAQPVPPQRQDAFIPALPRCRKRLQFLPVRHTSTLSFVTGPQQGPDCLPDGLLRLREPAPAAGTARRIPWSILRSARCLRGPRWVSRNTSPPCRTPGPPRIRPWRQLRK